MVWLAACHTLSLKPPLLSDEHHAHESHLTPPPPTPPLQHPPPEALRLSVILPAPFDLITCIHLLSLAFAWTAWSVTHGKQHRSILLGFKV